MIVMEEQTMYRLAENTGYHYCRAAIFAFPARALCAATAKAA
jgi:hypothetical protein